MPDKIIRTTHNITIITEIPFPEAFPGMNLTEAVEMQKNLDLESAVGCLVISTSGNYNTDVQVLPPIEAVQGVPEGTNTTRAEVSFTEHDDG